MSIPLSSSDRTESLMDWFQLHSRQVVWGSIALAAVVVGGWFYMRSQQLKAERAETAYFAAQRSVVSGNLPLAESDLRKMISR
jgi:predicted negative regulator of RcsB-dependent stress response